MSVKSWKAEFVPTTARSAAKQGPVAATKHALKRWQGFSKKNLAKHDLEWFKAAEGLPAFNITVKDCALCIYDDFVGLNDCSRCPLYLVRGDVPCGHPRLDELSSPSECYAKRGHAGAMIAWLKLALRKAKEIERRGKL